VEAILSCGSWGFENMGRITMDKDHRPGWARDELARMVVTTTEAYLHEQLAELQGDLAAVRLVRARSPGTAAVAKERRERADRRVAELEARVARECQLIAMQTSAGRATTVAEARLQDLERLLELARTCRRLLQPYASL
jgi:hypothetical protein